MKTIFTSFLLAAIAQAQDALTCLDKNFAAVGHPASGQSFSDWEYLISHESNEYSYRLTGVQLCGDNDGNLTGLEAFVGRFSNTSGNLLSTLAMNDFGDVTGVCNTLQLDALGGEYLQRIVFRFGAEKIDAISLSSSTGRTVFKGIHPADYTDETLTFTAQDQLVGFTGTSDQSSIFSLGQVNVASECVVAADPFVTPVENIAQNQWEQATGLDTTDTIIVAAVTTVVVLLIIGAAVGATFYIKKKNASSVQIMHRQSVKGVPDSLPRKASVKRVKGQIEIHQEIAQQNPTDVDEGFDAQFAAHNKAHQAHKNSGKADDIESGLPYADRDAV